VPKDPTLRRGLDPVPSRVPRLPANSELVEAAQAERARSAGKPVQPPPLVSATDVARSHRPQEFQLDKPARDWIDTTALAVRLRTGRGFNRSSLMRALVHAAQLSALKIGETCSSEEEITAYLLEFLPRK
jgi:hypothetical protein